LDLLQIVEILKQQSNHSIARNSVSRGDGTKTAIIDSDFDVVLLLDGRHPPFNRVLADFENILRRRPHIHGLRKTKSSIQFQYRKFDIILRPGTNHNHDKKPKTSLNPQTAPTGSSGHEHTKQLSISTPALDHHFDPVIMRPPNVPGTKTAWQAFHTYKAIQHSPQAAHLHSSSLWETYAHFMRSQCPFVYELVRICKFWNKSLLLSSSNVSGVSLLVELIAVYAGQLEEKRRQATNEQRSLVRAFKIFLELMQRFSQLQIQFDFDPLAPLRTKIGNWTPKCNSSLKALPYVIDPANPYTNVAVGISRAEMKQFQNYAVATLKRLGATLNRSRHYVPDMSNLLFCPQPAVIPFFDNSEKKAIQELYIVAEVTGVSNEDDLGGGGMSLPIEISDQRQYGKMTATLRHMRNLFTVVAHSFVSSYRVKGALDLTEDGILEEVRSALQKRMTHCVARHVCEKETSGKEEIDPNDDVVTFKIPLRIKEGLLLLWIHFQEVEEYEEIEEDESSGAESD